MNRLHAPTPTERMSLYDMSNLTLSPYNQEHLRQEIEYTRTMGGTMKNAVGYYGPIRNPLTGNNGFF